MRSRWRSAVRGCHGRVIFVYLACGVQSCAHQPCIKAVYKRVARWGTLCFEAVQGPEVACSSASPRLKKKKHLAEHFLHFVALPHISDFVRWLLCLLFAIRVLASHSALSMFFHYSTFHHLPKQRIDKRPLQCSSLGAQASFSKSTDVPSPKARNTFPYAQRQKPCLTPPSHSVLPNRKKAVTFGPLPLALQQPFPLCIVGVLQLTRTLIMTHDKPSSHLHNCPRGNITLTSRSYSMLFLQK